MELFSKKQIAELAVKFPEYQVLSAASDENGIHVCLMNAEGAPYVYTMASLDETIAPEKITATKVCASFPFGEASIDIDVCEMMDSITVALNSAREELETAKKREGTALDLIKQMQEAETKRRLDCAKAKATATLAAYNEVHEQAIEESAIADVMSDIEKGIYTNSVNDDGAWVGETAVENAVYAICAKLDIEQRALEAQKSKSVFAWDKFAQANDTNDSGTVNDLLRKKKIRQ